MYTIETVFYSSSTVKKKEKKEKICELTKIFLLIHSFVFTVCTMSYQNFLCNFRHLFLTS